MTAEKRSILQRSEKSRVLQQASNWEQLLRPATTGSATSKVTALAVQKSTTERGP